MELEEIAPNKGERALILGGSRSGKSTLMDMLLRHIVKVRPQVKGLLLDSKPRFRAQFYKRGPLTLEANKFYEDWAKGPTVPNSYRIDIATEAPFKGYWKDKDPNRILIAQSGREEERPRLLEIANDFYEAKMPNADRLLCCDELLDYYYGNGQCIAPKHNAPLKVARAGGERGIGSLDGAQRPRGIPGQKIEEISILYLFYLRFVSDMKYLWEQGIPTDIMPPDDLYAFKAVRIDPGGKATYLGKFRLTLHDNYLKQLSDT